MEPNSKKLERTSRFIYYAISTTLCVFLILLSNRIIDDLDSTVKRPYSENFEDKPVLATLEKDVEKQDEALENLYSKKVAIDLPA
jgi:hypothetical protein